ncbi:DUF2130 domain-containing protein [Pontibacterium granulatum]|uniref:DUF2130 domain-containing protein n=1 Tax=Pontibacterium granulatum TaxID=2036029 RepID=UPI00249AB912|nr:DUF2130 domain-containing protein [Pontibacterium granulatum]MDI3323398.1 DUF2130 domain-containing protein [Pontibacterium granulatum]
MADKIILDPQEHITCPHCEQQFALRDALTHQLIDRYEDEYATMLAKEREALEQRIGKEQARKQTREFEAKLAELRGQLEDSQVQASSAKKQLEAAKLKAAEQVRIEAQHEAKALQDELAEKDKKLAEFREAELTLRKQQKQLEEKQADMALELERKLSAEKSTIENKVRDSFALREAELKKKIADAQKSNEELTRKLEQGSQQLQGEVLELEIESMLRQSYPFDEIKEVKKGARGADVIQSVHLRSGTACGMIVWETKRAENWSGSWVPKLKEDQQAVGADIAVLVSTAFPADINEPMLVHDGVWLVKPELAKGLSEALRTVLIEAQRQRTVSVGKNEQMEALFDYICSNQFAQRVRSVVEGYEEMHSDLDKEKRAMQRLWKKREGQIGRISNQMISLCGELQGISASSLPHLDSIAVLEFEE